MLPGPLRRSCCLSGTSLPLRISLPVLGLTGDEALGYSHEGRHRVPSPKGYPVWVPGGLYPTNSLMFIICRRNSNASSAPSTASALPRSNPCPRLQPNGLSSILCTTSPKLVH